MSREELRAAVKIIVDEADPMQLLSMGAPDNEYDSEINDLTALLERGIPVTNELVTAVWRRWFGRQYFKGRFFKDMTKRLNEAMERTTGSKVAKLRRWIEQTERKVRVGLKEEGRV